MSAPAVATHGLTKHYGSALAVDHVDLMVAPGSIYGFLGLNGAGKSTTIRMLLGMIKPDAGYAEIFGRRVTPDATTIWAEVGHLVEFATAYPELSVRENLEVAGKLHRAVQRADIDDAIERLGLSRYADRAAARLSMGNLQRLSLARALLHSPRLLILDEPANGLDPAGVIEIRELLRSLATEHGVTIFMSSHLLAEVSRLATHIGLIHRGRLIEELDRAELEARLDRRLEVSTRDVDTAERALRQKGFRPARSSGPNDDVMLVLREACALAAPEEVAHLLCLAGVSPTRLVIAREDLEEHFVGLTNQANRSIT